MTFSDKEQIARVSDIFRENFRMTRLFAAYLENCPTLITKEMIDALTEDGGIDKKDAIIALLSEAFGLDSEKPSDRRFIREYLYPSVRLLDKKRYTENPYYKTVRIENIKDGDWEFKTEVYPPYRAMICDDMILNEDFSEVAPLGFFEEEFSFPAVLECGNEWMTLSPVDIDTCDEAIEAARGKVVTFGLGLGYFAFMVSGKEEVESITVVEKSEKVISLFKKHILPQFPCRDKVKIVCADAFEYAERIMPGEKFDHAFVDTWRDSSDGAPMMERMRELEHLSPECEFRYWIKNHLISRLRAAKYEEMQILMQLNDEAAPKSYKEFKEALLGV